MKTDNDDVKKCRQQGTHDIQGYRYNDALDRYGSYQVASRPTANSDKSVIADAFSILKTVKARLQIRSGATEQRNLLDLRRRFSIVGDQITLLERFYTIGFSLAFQFERHLLRLNLAVRV